MRQPDTDSGRRGRTNSTTFEKEGMTVFLVFQPGNTDAWIGMNEEDAVTIEA